MPTMQNQIPHPFANQPHILMYVGIYLLFLIQGDATINAIQDSPTSCSPKQINGLPFSVH